MNRIRQQVAELRSRLLSTLAERDQALKQTDARLQQASETLRRDTDKLAKQLAQQQQALEADGAAKREEIEARVKRHAERAHATCARLRARFQAAIQARTTALKAKQEQIHTRAERTREEKFSIVNNQCTQILSQLAAFETSTQELGKRVEGLARKHGVALDPIRFKERLDQVPVDPEPAAREIAHRIGEIVSLLDAAERKRSKSLPAYLLYPPILLLGTAAFFALSGFQLDLNSRFLLPVVGGVALVMFIIASWRHSAKSRIYSTAMALSQNVSTTCTLIERQKALTNAYLEQTTRELDAERAAQVAPVDTETEAHTKDNSKAASAIAARLQAYREKLGAKNARKKEADQMRLRRNAEASASRLVAEHEQALARRQKEHAAAKHQIDEDGKQEVARCARRWAENIAQAAVLAQEVTGQIRTVQPPWREIRTENWTLPQAFQSEVYQGQMQLTLRALVPESDETGPFSLSEKTVVDLPAILTYPLEGSLCIRAGLARREQTIQTLFGSVLRILCSCPPGKAKLTVIDPVGLGQSFAALMHLADHDESLVGIRIWCETAHIEKRLSELTDHMEKVIQKYLRNRYQSIDEYNREAGALAEPYRFLVIADFPTGFSELALERLASIISTGMRCGVYTLIFHDSRQKLPLSLDESLFRKNGLLITEADDGFVVDDDKVARGKFSSEEAPASTLIDVLLHVVGKQSRQAMRVQVPFEAAAPKPHEYWSSSSVSGIRLPLGKTGADRLQYLELGAGTSQHALIAGKTGSGKSNLFHVIITNGSLWYSPRELEFYLIDFKKGVEFKSYAAHRLAHARVVAIESDREFGLSVLRRIDKELAYRGELFRKARVQDFPSYRQSNPDKVLPRSLLVIDEFQEFFTDEDGVSQEAALLLDRVVRQGRAFGIHVVLGTQTLGGTYSLAKSTLGQVAVRVALQCNESDSSMVLSDGNLAAALLSRPGEAIYNDMSGLVEGNNPFQAVYFPQGAQDPYLRVLSEKSAAQTQASTQTTVVFEGNEFADLRNNPLLRDQASRTPSAQQPMLKVWLGEPNAIKAATDVQFMRHSGCNLLFIGERPDAQLALCSATILSLAAGSATEQLRIRVLDGTLPDSGAREHLLALCQALPHDIKLIDYADVPRTIEELSATLKARQEGTEATDGRCFLLALGLDKFRMLREAEEFSFSSSDSDSDGDSATAPAAAFGNLITEGPSQGMHTIVWCDKLANLNRFFSRKTLREFEMRVLYQMSTTDSSELIDSMAANKLGLYNALLYTAQSGGVEKFRPYGTPELEFITELGSILRSRGVTPAARPAPQP